ncbi:hypothetical protein P5673_006564 [Acropora cervicornis]|uniref:Uncharacterized protein n=1 Tax=Acropora cervicornis TaxID=6130 RepID=A0AAD9VC45_ACRCE|nr:hypothetical protein P5673_006564 [Acropora cervicornis]
MYRNRKYFPPLPSHAKIAVVELAFQRECLAHDRCRKENIKETFDGFCDEQLQFCGLNEGL